MYTLIKLLGITSEGFDVINQRLMVFCICQILKNKLRYKGTVHQLFIDFKKACDSVMRGVLSSNLTEFGIPMKLDWLSKMCLNETYTKHNTGKHFSDAFPI